MKKIGIALLLTLCAVSMAAVFTGCGNVFHVHSYDKQVVAKNFIAKEATCTEKAVYYFSCECGACSVRTFESGEPLGHDYDAPSYVWGENYSECVAITACLRNANHTLVEAVNATSAVTQNKDCLLDEETTFTAKFANALFGTQTKTVVTAEKTGHAYSDEWSSDENSHWRIATCEHSGETTVKENHTASDWIVDTEATQDRLGQKYKECTVCKTVLETEELPKLAKDKITFNTLVIGDNGSAYAKVANAETTFNFDEEISISGNATYVVALDGNGIFRSLTNAVPLSAGDNTFFVLEILSGKVTNVYTVTIRRRPIYTVYLEKPEYSYYERYYAYQSIEEDSFATEPQSPEKAGYTFNGWDYDFSKAITENTYVNAEWSANTDTKYKVEYYWQNIEDNNYSLHETVDLQGTTDTTAVADQKDYEHFTFNNRSGILNGNIVGDGSLVLKLYYTRDKYTLSSENSEYGETMPSGLQKYGALVSAEAIEYLGCEFVGWYNGEELLSEDKNYSFNIDKNITAKFKTKDEMADFTLTSTKTTCKIINVKDNSVMNVIIPEYVTSIGCRAFYECSKLARITIPNSLTNIENDAFSGCGRLTNIYINNIESWCKISGLNYLMNYGSSKKLYLSGEEIIKLTIPNSVTSLGSGAFANCRGLISVTIPDSVTSIGSSAFEYCSGLTSVTIPDSVTSIGSCAFAYCSGLTSVTIPNSVTSIGSNVFRGCSGLASVTIPNSVTSIGYSAFYECSSLKSILIPDGVTSIEESTFMYCRELLSVTIGNGVTIIKEDAFYACMRLSNITVGNGVTIIEEDAFLDCDSLTNIYINSIESWCKITGLINLMWFRDSTSKKLYLNGEEINKLTISNNITSIENYVFYSCRSLKEIEISADMVYIGRNAFYNCSGLKSVRFGGTIEQWNAIVKGSNWKYGVPADCVVHCTDGDINI